jgi:hypothetical protein
MSNDHNRPPPHSLRFSPGKRQLAHVKALLEVLYSDLAKALAEEGDLHSARAHELADLLALTLAYSDLVRVDIGRFLRDYHDRTQSRLDQILYERSNDGGSGKI